MIPLAKRQARARPGGERGFTLVEGIIALALMGTIVTALLVGLSTLAVGADFSYDRGILAELGESQLESIQKQSYQETASNYTVISPIPTGYAVSVSATPAVTYTYASPGTGSTQETIQELTVTVTGVRGNLTLKGYKVRR